MRAGADRDDDIELRVATYNIRAGVGVDDRFDLERTAAVLASLDAEVIGLQEVDIHWSQRSDRRDLAADLGERLGMRSFAAPIYRLAPPQPGAPVREYGVAVLSRLPVTYAVNHEITRLSSQHTDAGPTPAPGFAEVAVEKAGSTVHVYVTHLDHRPEPGVREQQVADMLRLLGKHAERPQVLLGDLNARPGAPELAPLWERLNDAWASVHGRDGGLTFPACRPDRRIDYIATSGLEARTIEPITSQASDHLPLVADLAGTAGTTQVVFRK